MARYESFKEVCHYSDVMTTDSNGYLTVEVSKIEQFFSDSFEKFVAEIINGRSLPEQPELLTMLQSDGLMSRPNPIESHFRKCCSKRKTRKQINEFQRIVTECLPICIENVRALKRDKEQRAEEERQVVSIGEAAQFLGISKNTLLNWVRLHKIEAHYREFPEGMRCLIGIPQTALKETTF
jgi:hypothetical protein